jgi:peptidoglycan-associated lipoprotein
MKKGTQIFLTVGLGLFLFQSGCSKKITPISGSAGLTEDRIAENRSAGEAPVPSSGLKEERVPAESMKENKEERLSAAEAAAAAAGVSLDDIFFEFDQAAIKEESKVILQKDAKFILSNPNAKVQIQGHTDERGSEEYNLALGARRAQIVKRFLTALGVEPNRLQTISFGEEKPFCNQSEEGCWKQNRRAHFSVQSPR